MPLLFCLVPREIHFKCCVIYFYKMERLANIKRNHKGKKTTVKKSGLEPIEPPEKKDNETPREQALRIATELWEDIKRRVRETPEFASLKDQEKIDVYQNSKYKDFYVSQPIVCRYMICMGQYSGKAFKRFLMKCESMVGVPASSDTEDQWVMRQSDYVRYLWESYQKQHFSQAEAQAIWQHAYNTLKKEFTDFKKLHEEIEEKLKREEKNSKVELVRELINRVSSEEQHLDDNSTKQLLQSMQQRAMVQRRRNLINQIDADVDRVRPTTIACGRADIK
jgi:hypothetical protein